MQWDLQHLRQLPCAHDCPALFLHDRHMGYSFLTFFAGFGTGCASSAGRFAVADAPTPAQSQSPCSSALRSHSSWPLSPSARAALGVADAGCLSAAPDAAAAGGGRTYEWHSHMGNLRNDATSVVSTVGAAAAADETHSGVAPVAASASRAAACKRAAISSTIASMSALLFDMPRRSRRSVYVVRGTRMILNMCPRTIESDAGNLSHSSRYSRAICHTGGLMPANSAGLARFPSADMTPCTPVCSMHRAMSSNSRTLPLAYTGMLTLSLTALIAFQSAMPVLCPFWSRVRPWTVSSWHPAASIILAYASVLSMLGNTRILHVTGTDKCLCSVLTILAISSHSSIRYAPYRPRRAMC
eukprot:Opistho-2@52246